MYTLESSEKFVTSYLESPWILDNRELAIVESWKITLKGKIESYQKLAEESKNLYQVKCYLAGIQKFTARLSELEEILKADKLAKKFSCTSEQFQNALKLVYTNI